MSEKLAPIILSDKMSTAINGFFAAIYYVVSRNDVLKKKKKPGQPENCLETFFRGRWTFEYIFVINTSC